MASGAKRQIVASDLDMLAGQWGIHAGRRRSALDGLSVLVIHVGKTVALGGAPEVRIGIFGILVGLRGAYHNR